ncbi:MAG: glycosyltransferase [Acidimicrobiia bacterium]|nr:glycosyltransferase [Acidimicrobiia bacterium]
MHIVVLAYGPGSHTKRAVHRARKLVGTGQTLSVVPASTVGRDAMENLAGAKKIETIGTAGLRTAFEGLGTESTLLIHDDVVLTTRGLMALERELAAGARFAVPYSNDQAMEYFVGSLPAGKDAERFLDQVPVPDESRPVDAVRSACIAGAAEDLIELLGESLPDPYAAVTSTELGFVVAGGALASHETQCVHQLADPEGSESPLLVAALIVKDEEEMLPDCIASLQEVCDRIEICDTGSSDRTVSIAEAAGAVVSHTEWNDDFGAARNFVLERCRDAQYVIVVDADERVSCADPEHTRRYLATYAREHPAFRVEVANFESDGTELYRFTTVRIFQAQGTEYVGSLHEMVHLNGEDLPLDGHRFDQIKIDHHGYAGDLISEKDKAIRNLELAEAQHEIDNDARSAIHLARSLTYAHESPERALELLEQGLTGTRSKVAEAQIKGLIADRLVALSEYRRAFDMAAEALELLPGDDTALGALGAATDKLGNHQEFIAIGERQRGANSAKHVIKIDHNRLVFQDRMIAAYAAIGQVEQAVEIAIATLAEDSSALRSWPELIDALNSLCGAASTELLLPMALLDVGGGFLEPAIKTYPSDTLAGFCAAYLERGGRITEVIRVGLLAAAMSGNDAAFDAMVPAVRDLDESTRTGLAQRIAAGGRSDLAEKLFPEPVAAR